MYVIRRTEDGCQTYLAEDGSFTDSIQDAQQFDPIERAIKALSDTQGADEAYYDICVNTSAESLKASIDRPPMTAKEIRAMTGLSQVKFAKRYGIPIPTVEAWERGLHSSPEWVMKLLERAVRQDFNHE